MKCERIIEKYLEQEDCRYPSLLIRLHSVICAPCRKEIKELRGVFVNARINSLFVMRRSVEDTVMSNIYKSEIVYDNTEDLNISSSKWAYTGLILFASIILVNYSDSFLWLREHLGSSLEIPVNIVLGLAITFYAASYIATHLKGLKKIAEFINSKMH